MTAESTPPSRELTLAQTNVAKGWALVLMFVHHLFTFSDRVSWNAWISIFPFSFKEAPVEHYIGLFGKVCVALFLFLSGYGLYRGAQGSQTNPFIYTLKKIWGFYLRYWLCFIVFIPIGLYFFSWQARFTADSRLILLNFLGVSHTFSMEWWFIKTYFLLLCFFPFVFIIAAFRSWLLLLIAPLYLYFWPRIGFGNDLLLWQGVFLLGMAFAAGNYFEKLWFLFHPKQPAWLAWPVFLAAFFLRFGFKEDLRWDLILAPFLVYYAPGLLPWKMTRSSLETCGRYAIYLWLTHTFFCYYYFQNIVLIPRVSIFILIWLFLLSLGPAFILEGIIQGPRRWREWKSNPQIWKRGTMAAGTVLVLMFLGVAGVQTKKLFARSEPHSLHLVDLSNYYNAKTTDTSADTVGSPHNHLGEFPLGTNEFGGTQFKVDGILRLGNRNAHLFRKRLPFESPRIPVTWGLSKIHLLHGTEYFVKDGEETGSVVFHYQNGSKTEIPLRYGVHFRDWYERTEEPISGKESELVWKGTNPFSRSLNARLRVYKTTLPNPDPTTPLASIQLVSRRGECALFFLGITTE